MNIALLGFGTVGKAFYELTLGRSDLRVTSVLSRRPRPELPCTVTNDFDEIVRDRSVGIVVEVMGGLVKIRSRISQARIIAKQPTSSSVRAWPPSCHAAQTAGARNNIDSTNRCKNS